MRALRPVGTRRAARVVDGIYLACQLLAAAILLAFIIGSLLFTGGQLLADDGQLYGEVWRWPVFYVPAWLLIIPAAISAVLVIPLVVMTSVAEADGLIGRWGQMIVAVGAGFGFAVIFPASTGPLPVPNDSGDTSVGTGWRGRSSCSASWCSWSGC